MTVLTILTVSLLSILGYLNIQRREKQMSLIPPPLYKPARL